MGKRDANVDVRATSRKLQGDLNRVNSKFKKSFKSIGKGATRAIGAIGALGMIGGGFALGQEALDFEKTLTRIAIQGGDIGLLDGLRISAKSIASEFGLSQLAVAEGLNEIVNLQGAAGISADKLRLLAEANVATGASMKDLAGTTFALQNAFGLTDPKDLRQALDAIIAVGKEGSVPLEEMNALLQKGAKQFSAFTSRGAAGAAELGASFQILRKGFGSGAEAQTGLKALLNQIDSSERKLNGLGITVSKLGPNGKRQVLPLVEILGQMEKKNLLNKKIFPQIFGSAEARQSVKLLIENKDRLDDLTQAGLKAKSSQEDAATFLATSAGRQQKALAAAKQALVDLATPERIEKFTGALETLAEVVAFAADNMEILLAATVAFKTGGFLVSLFQGAKAMKLLGTNSKTTAGQIAAANVAGQGGGVGGGVGGKPGLASKLGAASIAGAIGFEVGTFIEEKTGIGKGIGGAIGEADRRSAEKKLIASLNKQDEAVRSLKRQGLTQGRILDPALSASLAAKEAQLAKPRTRGELVSSFLGGGDTRPQLTEQEQSAKLALESGIITEESGFARIAREQNEKLESIIQEIINEKATAAEKLIAAIDGIAGGINLNVDGTQLVTTIRNSSATKRNPRL